MGISGCSMPGDVEVGVDPTVNRRPGTPGTPGGVGAPLGSPPAPCTCDCAGLDVQTRRGEGAGLTRSAPRGWSSALGLAVPRSPPTGGGRTAPLRPTPRRPHRLLPGPRPVPAVGGCTHNAPRGWARWETPRGTAPPLVQAGTAAEAGLPANFRGKSVFGLPGPAAAAGVQRRGGTAAAAAAPLSGDKGGGPAGPRGAGGPHASAAGAASPL